MAIGGDPAVDALIDLMRKDREGRSIVSFLRYLRMLGEKGDAVIPVVMRHLMDKNEDPMLQRGIFISALYDLDKTIDYWMNLLVEQPEQAGREIYLMHNFIAQGKKHFTELETIKPRVLNRLSYYAQNGTKEQRYSALTFIGAFGSISTDMVNALRLQLSTEKDPDVKMMLQELLKWVDLSNQSGMIKPLDGVNVGAPLLAFDESVISDTQRALFLLPKDASQKLGGIDLDPRKLDLQIKRDGNGVPLSVDEQDWSKINIQGFVPVIYKIEPVNMPALLGFNDVSLTPAMAT